MKNLFVRFVKNDSGATAIEYGLIAAGISVAIIAVVNGLGTTLNTKFDSIKTQLATKAWHTLTNTKARSVARPFLSNAMGFRIKTCVHARPPRLPA